MSSLGLTSLWQVALLLPTGWDDLTCPVRVFDRVQPGPALLLGVVADSPDVRFDGTPRLIGYLHDADDRRVGFSVFGDTRDFYGQLADFADAAGQVALFGQLEEFNGKPWLKSPVVVPPEWIGRLRPRYQGKTRVINPDTVRDRVVRYLEKAIPHAVEFLSAELAEFGTPAQLADSAGLRGWSLERIIRAAHLPGSLVEGEKAQRAMECLAALGIVKRANISHASVARSASITPGDWTARGSSIPFLLTSEQLKAINDAVEDIMAPAPMRRILAGDVGTGKTAVYGTISAAVVDGGGSVVVLCPTESLARQVTREFGSWWPDIAVQLVTGGSDEELSAPVLVGTTALLSRDLGTPDLVIVDEQQKFSVAQREQLVGTETNLLEVTATCIPRSQALVRYGVVKVSRLTKCHTAKNITTRIRHRGEWKGLVGDVFGTIKSGGQVLLVYPLREKGEQDAEDSAPKDSLLKSAEEIHEKWSAMLPGRVCWIHGQMSDDEKGEALAAMRNGLKDLMVATTVVEVGVDLPKLRRVVVVHPDRHGLTTLHQIRGRVARKGGEGWCDLFLPYPVKDATMERLRVLEATTDGFKVAEQDMRLRGIGDLSHGATRQSGADEMFLYGRSVRMEVLDEVMGRLQE